MKKGISCRFILQLHRNSLSNEGIIRMASKGQVVVSITNNLQVSCHPVGPQPEYWFPNLLRISCDGGPGVLVPAHGAPLTCRRQDGDLYLFQDRRPHYLYIFPQSMVDTPVDQVKWCIPQKIDSLNHVHFLAGSQGIGEIVDQVFT